jgi:hypothetical protein
MAFLQSDFLFEKSDWRGGLRHPTLEDDLHSRPARGTIAIKKAHADNRVTLFFDMVLLHILVSNFAHLWPQVFAANE